MGDTCTKSKDSNFASSKASEVGIKPLFFPDLSINKTSSALILWLIGMVFFLLVIMINFLWI